MAQTSFGQIQKVIITWSFTEGIIISAEIQSRTRIGLIHYTRIVLDQSTLKIRKETCSCEAWTHNRKCWHLKTLEGLVTSDPKIREEIENAKRELEKTNDTAFWG